MVIQQVIYWSIVIGIGAGLILFADTPAADRLYKAFIRRMNRAGRRI